MLDARTKTLSVNFQYLNFIESTKQDKPTSVARVESFFLTDPNHRRVFLLQSAAQLNLAFVHLG